jgi:MoaA/NifB/PqqE/SkfB family radical SAM enzyme
MKTELTVIWQLTRQCELRCRHCPHPTDRAKNPQELTTYECYCLVNQVVQLSPARFIISGGDPLTRDDVYQLVDHARRRGLDPAVTLSPTANVTTEAIARLRRNGLARIIVSLEGASAESHEGSCGVPGSYLRTLHIIGTALTSGIDVEVNTLVTRDNIAVLEAIYERIERLGVVAWNVHLPVLNAHVEPLNSAQAAHVRGLVQRIRTRGLTQVRIIDGFAPTVFITAEGFVRNGEFSSGNNGDLRRSSLEQICRSH